MARYIEATKCAEIISEKLGIRLFDLVDVFAEIPTADVVPKSEVEQLITLNSQLEAKVFDTRKELDILKSTITHKEDESYNEGYADAVNEVLTEIKALMQFIALDYKEVGSFDNAEIVGYVQDHLIAELTKRYVEGEE